MTDFDKLVVYTDAACPFCRWSRDRVEQWDTHHRLEFRDLNDSALIAETPFTAAQLRGAMHVRTPDAVWHTGYFGWIAVLAELPRRRWLARILTLPPVRWLGPLFYRTIARNRYRIPGFILRGMGAPPACPPEGTCHSS